jgi:hypothetical protein
MPGAFLCEVADNFVDKIDIESDELSGREIPRPRSESTRMLGA